MVDTAITAMTDRMRGGASNTHGVFLVSEAIAALIADARRAGGDFLGCDPHEVVFGQNATSLLLHLSRALGRTWGPGDEVIVTRLDHDANVRPWLLAARDAGATVRGWTCARTMRSTSTCSTRSSEVDEARGLHRLERGGNGAARGGADATCEVGRSSLDGDPSQHHAVDLHGVTPTSSPSRRILRPAQTAELYKLRAAPARTSTGETGTRAESLAGTSLRSTTSPTAGWPIGELSSPASTRSPPERASLDGSSRALPGCRRCSGIADPDRRRAHGDIRDPRGRAAPARHVRRLGRARHLHLDGHYYAIEVFDRLGPLDTGGAVRIGFVTILLDEVDRARGARRAGGLRRSRAVPSVSPPQKGPLCAS
jgi:hypothetical protein